VFDLEVDHPTAVAVQLVGEDLRLGYGKPLCRVRSREPLGVSAPVPGKEVPATGLFRLELAIDLLSGSRVNAV
jgi:hypothetical protein